MTYKNRADAKIMADYYAKKASKEARKLVLIEGEIRKQIIEVLNEYGMLGKGTREKIQTDIEILDEIDENLNSYKKCRDEADKEADMYAEAEEGKENEANTGMAECASIFAQEAYSSDEEAKQ